MGGPLGAIIGRCPSSNGDGEMGNGIIKHNRKCRDLVFLILFIAFWVAMIVNSSFAFNQGNPLRDLSSNNFSGQLPLSLEKLSSLTTLHVQNNQLTGTLDVLQDLPLRDLDIENNLFSGPVPGKMISIPIFKLMYGLDYKGNVCGNKHADPDLSELEIRYWLNPNQVYQSGLKGSQFKLADARSVCLMECPEPFEG